MPWSAATPLRRLFWPGLFGGLCPGLLLVLFLDFVVTVHEGGGRVQQCWGEGMGVWGSGDVGGSVMVRFAEWGCGCYPIVGPRGGVFALLGSP